MPRHDKSFRIGRVKGYLRGNAWYLCYHESGQRRRPRIGHCLETTRRTAARINAELESGQPSLLNFQPISIPDLRQRWLDHHEHVKRSSVNTIARYRAATQHLLNFLKQHPIRLASGLTAREAGLFVRYLRTIEVAPNGHPNSARRRLLDKGVRYVLECCRTMYAYAMREQHLPPYAQNPLATCTADVGGVPLEDSKPIVLLTPAQELQFLEACDEWQFSIFFTLMFTGLRPGELCHLLVEDVDLQGQVLHVRNKPELGWQVKTRAQRHIPLVPVLVEVLKVLIGSRRAGSVFLQSRCERYSHVPPLSECRRSELAEEAVRRLQAWVSPTGSQPTRRQRLAVLRTIWRDLAALSEDRVRIEFIRVCRRIGLLGQTAPKVLRHGFATSLQDVNVDPLIRMQLMGRSPPGGSLGMPTNGALGMTAVYTHSRTETVRAQLNAAMAARAAAGAAAKWLERRAARAASSGS